MRDHPGNTGIGWMGIIAIKLQNNKKQYTRIKYK